MIDNLLKPRTRASILGEESSQEPEHFDATYYPAVTLAAKDFLLSPVASERYRAAVKDTVTMVVAAILSRTGRTE